MDRKQIIVSTAASLGVMAVGFYVWRYQQGVSADQAQANSDAEQAHVDSMNSAIQSLQQGIGSYVPQYGNGASGSSVPDTGSTSLQTPADQSSGLADILKAFFGDAGTAATKGSSLALNPTVPSGVNSGDVIGISQTPSYNPVPVYSGTSLNAGTVGDIPTHRIAGMVGTIYPYKTPTLNPTPTGKLYN